jgi:Mrp family chromosome partitioning ATPase
MSSLLEILKTKFDVIIVDTPPVLPVSDPSILAPKMDATVIVYEIGRTSREALLRTKIQLESADAKLVGVILNNTQPQSEGMSPYPYYYRYRYRYYKKEEGDQDKKRSVHT